MSVGALTSMPYAFNSRAWELKSVDSIDILDTMASSVKIDISNNVVVRILPNLNENLNEDWITNKARFVYDSFVQNRINFPKLRILNKFIFISWIYVIKLFLNLLYFYDFRSLIIVSGFFIDLEGACALKDFFNRVGYSNICCFETSSFTDFRFYYLLCTSILNFEVASFIFLFFSNLRFESPLLNSRLRKNYLYNSNKFLPIFCFGFFSDYLTFPVKVVGNCLKSVFDLLLGKFRYFCDFFFFKFIGSSFFCLDWNLLLRPIIILGGIVAGRLDFYGYLNIFISNFQNFFCIQKNWHWFNLLSISLGKISSSEIGLNGVRELFSDFGYFCGDYNFNLNLKFLIYQGFFKGEGLIFRLANLILPISIYIEHESVYLNMEGRFRFTKIISQPNNNIFTDSKIIQMLNYFSTNISYIKSSIFCKFLSILLNLTFLFGIVNYNNCIFFYNISSFFKRFLFISGFSLKWKEMNLNFNNYIIFFMIYNLRNFCLKFLNSIFSRLINNYYNFDMYCKNSKILSLYSLRAFVNTFS